jgi:hypothetical protein
VAPWRRARWILALSAVAASSVVFCIYAVDGWTIWHEPFAPGIHPETRQGWDRISAEAEIAWLKSEEMRRILPWLAAAALPTLAAFVGWLRDARGRAFALVVPIGAVVLFECVSLSYAAWKFAAPYVRGTWPRASRTAEYIADPRWSFGYLEEALRSSDPEMRAHRCRWLRQSLDGQLGAEIREKIPAQRLDQAIVACAAHPDPVH